nr:hypothetical protein Itr_chr02CG22170 [Ipomoea trifida]
MICANHNVLPRAGLGTEHLELQCITAVETAAEPHHFEAPHSAPATQVTKSTVLNINRRDGGGSATHCPVGL